MRDFIPKKSNMAQTNVTNLGVIPRPNGESIRVEKIRKKNSRFRICLESSGLSYINIPEQLGRDPGSFRGFQRQLRQKERKFALPRKKTTREALDISVIP